jgi:tetratricopeptide (TPR) repeat protein
MRKVLIGISIFALVIVSVAISFSAWKFHASARELTKVFLTLQVNRERQVSVLPGTPLVFALSLSGAKTDPPLRIGGSGNPWYRYLRLESADDKKQIPFSWSLLGKPRSFYPRFSSSGDLVGAELYTGDEAILDNERNLYTAELGVAPEETAKIPQGKYTIRAVLEVSSGSPGKWSGRAVSNPVVVSVEERIKETTPADDQEWNRLVESINFYLRAGRFEDAHGLALQAVEQKQDNVDSHILLGDALNGMRRDEEALKSYRKALFMIATKGKQYEPPTYLMLRIDEVKQRLKQR